MRKTRVLFLCTANTARSQMAEAFLKRYASEKFEAYSAGLEPREIHHYTRKVLEEVGIDLRDHYSKGLDQFLGKIHFGYLITVCDKAEAACPIFPGVGQRLFWPFEDPVAFEGNEDEKLNKFREVRDRIDERVQLWLQEIESGS